MINKTEKSISIYVRNSEEGPSCYYRICQFLDDLNYDKKIDIMINNALNKKDFRRNLDEKIRWKKKILQCFYYVKILINRSVAICRDLSQKPDYIIVQREVFPHYLPKIIKILYIRLLKNSNVIWDFDDDILGGREISKEEWEILLSYSNTIIATSDYLLNQVKRSQAVKIALPTTDGFFSNYDFNSCMKQREDDYDRIIRIVWVGTASNLSNIVKIIPDLDKTSLRLKGIKQVELDIISNIDHPSFYNYYENLMVNYKRWTREDAQTAIISSHIGLMPLPDTVNSKGKGGFKLIQYMSSGVPVIASAIGMNCDIVSSDVGILVGNENQWAESIYYLCNNKSLWKEYSINAKRRYEERFSYNSSLDIWRSILLN